MRAADVRILAALEPGESYVEPNFLLVETTRDAACEPVTTIHHVRSEGIDRGGWNVTSLGHSTRLSHAAACEWAVSYAASRDIPLVYERDDHQRAAYAAALNTTAPADGVKESAAK